MTDTTGSDRKLHINADIDKRIRQQKFSITHSLQLKPTLWIKLEHSGVCVVGEDYEIKLKLKADILGGELELLQNENWEDETKKLYVMPGET